MNELKAELNKTLKATLGESVSFKEAANQDELEKVLDTLSVGYDAMSTSELKQVTVQNAADFKQIVEESGILSMMQDENLQRILAELTVEEITDTMVAEHRKNC